MTTEDRKAAEAAVKAAEKVYAAASKKADDALERYRPLRAASNAAARALAHAKTHPALFDDDSLTVVSPHLAAGGADITNVYVAPLPAPQAPPAAAEPPVALPAPAPAPDPEPVYAEDPEGYADAAPTGAAPWEVAAEPPSAPPAEEAKPAPRRRRAAAKPKEEAAPEPPAAVAAPQGPPGTVFVGYTAEGAPVFQAAQAVQQPPQPPAQQLPAAQPGAAPWETGAAPLY